MLALNGNQYVAGQVFLRDVPGLVAKLTQAANAQTLALANGVVHQALMAADHLAIGGLDISGLRGNVLFEEIPEFAFPDKADTGGVFLVVGDKALFGGNAPYFRFFKLAHWKERTGNTFARDGVQEVALVLVGVKALEQFGSATAVVQRALAGVVAGGNVVSAQGNGVIEKRPELHFLVAEDIGIRGPASLVFRQEVLEYPIPVFRRKAGGVQRNTDGFRHRLSVR